MEGLLARTCNTIGLSQRYQDFRNFDSVTLDVSFSVDLPIIAILAYDGNKKSAQHAA